ncbi:contractile injection system protein, VgrG/Pvc8 family [Novosphingobium huizhouense]|uniref:contractile injection system protein, VgrG/Pvc8 family n=1 Tax=Novosphingobium huizhouense TaxID=2866625 RepID=UPI001CD89F55|nr:contractile injection system protein, VgrG/Pvc8 family [Novosphingobium huizhouense]
MKRAASAFVEARPAWRVTLDGADLTARFAPRLISLRLREGTGEEADEVEIVVDDSDGKFAPPKAGSELTVELGWERGTEVRVGLVPKGIFVVDELSWSGPPDQITVTARSADFKGPIRTRKTRTFKDTTVGALIEQLAADNDLEPRCHPDLAGKPVAAAEQHNKPDMELLRDLGRHFDATATVKAGALIFAPRGSSTSATGRPIPAVTVRRDQCSRASWRRAQREKGEGGAEAQWHDQDEGKRKTVQHGTGNANAPRRRLKRVYASEADAKTAAQSEAARIKRASASLELELAFGDTAIAPSTPVTVEGFRGHIDGQKWRVASAEHSMDARGLSTRLTLEIAG